MYPQQQAMYPQQKTPNFGPPPQSTPAFFTREQYQQILQLLSKGNEEAPGSSSRLAPTCNLIALMTNFVNRNWIIDTGASNYMTSRLDMLKLHCPIPNTNRNVVHLPNKEVVSVSHKGNSTV